MVHKGSYGDLMLVPGLSDAIAFAHTGDNLEPQSEEQLHQAYQELHNKFPGTQVVASTLNAFADQLQRIKSSLPVITAEIGDTWIHGGGTDPLKISQFRQLLRWRNKLLEMKPVDFNEGAFNEFSRRLLLIPEHTWGMDIKTHLGDFSAYSANDFKNARSGPGYKKVEQSWAEQRAYITQAIDCLSPETVKQSARAALKLTEPTPPDLADYEPLANPTGPYETAYFKAGFDPATGALIRLDSRQSIKRWSAPDRPFGMIRYETFSNEDYAHFYRDYVKNKRETAEWSIPDFTKPGMGDAASLHKTWLPWMEKGWKKEENGAIDFYSAYLCQMRPGITMVVQSA